MKTRRNGRRPRRWNPSGPARPHDDNLNDLRQTVLNLQKTVEKLRQELETVQKKEDAKKSGRRVQPGMAPGNSRKIAGQ